MKVFLLVFLILYGLIHLYSFLKLRAAFNLGTLLQIIVVLFMFAMIFSPVIIRSVEKQGFELLAIVLSWVGYLWMALIFLFFFFALVIDLGKFFFFLFSKIIGKGFSLSNIFGLSHGLTKKVSFLLPFGLSLFVLIYGYFEALNIKIERIVIETSKVIKNIRIVQISDMHIGLIIREGRVRKVVEKIKEANPDILVSTGDLVDGQIDRLNGVADILKEVRPSYGKFAITGNHEFFAGLNQALFFINKAGFKVLRNGGIYIENLNINLIGVDDLVARRYEKIPNISEKALLKNFQNSGFTVLLKHRPIVDKESIGLFDLQLSGHTHKGQLFPFNIITAIYYPKDSGCLRDINGCYLYISKGAGTWGPPVRIFAPPEITIIDIIRKENKK